MKRQSRFNKKPRAVTQNCNFCHTQTKPEYNDISMLTKYTSERGKILGRSKTGICSKHQRGLTESIKRARHLSLMPFVVRA